MQEYSFVIFVDGDNLPRKRTEGIERLRAGDEVYIFESEDAIYFNAERQAELRASSKANVVFRRVKAGKDSADFAIAMAIARKFPQGITGNSIACLISGDRHFDIIAHEFLAGSESKIPIERIDTIKTAVDKFYLLRAENAGDLHNYFVKRFGAEMGKDTYRHMSELFEKSAAESKAASRSEKQAGGSANGRAADDRSSSRRRSSRRRSSGRCAGAEKAAAGTEAGDYGAEVRSAAAKAGGTDRADAAAKAGDDRREDRRVVEEAAAISQAARSSGRGLFRRGRSKRG